MVYIDGREIMLIKAFVAVLVEEYGFRPWQLQFVMCEPKESTEVIILGKKFKELLEEETTSTKYPDYDIRLSPEGRLWRMEINALQRPAPPLLPSLLNRIIGRLEDEKCTEIMNSKALISAALCEICRSFNPQPSTKVWYKKKLYHALIRVNGKKFGFSDVDRNRLIDDIKVKLPQFLSIILKQ